MTYELVDQTSGNVLGDWRDQGQALNAARDMIQSSGQPERFVLVEYDDRDEEVGLVAGRMLAQLATSEAARDLIAW